MLVEEKVQVNNVCTHARIVCGQREMKIGEAAYELSYQLRQLMISWLDRITQHKMTIIKIINECQVNSN